MKKAVIFDMDGLMIDSEKVTFHYYNEVFQERGYPFSFDIYKQFLGKHRLQVQKIIRELYGEDFPTEEIWDEIHVRVYDYMRKQVPLKPGLIELLEYLKKQNYKLMVATGSDRWRLDIIFESAKIGHYFDAIVCGNEVSKGKPDPEIFLTACLKAHVKPSETIVLEDSESGILAAYNGGIEVICIPDMKYPEKQFEEKATKIFSSLYDVIPYLEENH